MARGNGNRGRGARGSPRGKPTGGRGRGSGNSRGRGRGRGRGGAGGGGIDIADVLDFPVQMWPDSNRGAASPSPRARGRGAGAPFSRPNSGHGTPNRGRDSPRGRGRGEPEPYGRGRGRGRGGSKLRPDAPLSKLLYEERPFLRPVIFVPSVHTRTLFQQEEEILQPVVEDVGDEENSHVPTADRVTRVFSGAARPPMYSSASEDDQAMVEDAEELEEIDFNDMGKFREQLDAAPPPHTASKSKIEMDLVEERFTGFYVDTDPTSIVSPSTISGEALVPGTVNQGATTRTSSTLAPPSAGEEYSGFYIDSTPDTTTTPHPPGRSDTRPSKAAPAIEEDEEIIVYVAPHPRSGKLAAIPEPSTPATPLPSTSIITGTTQPSLPSPITPTPSSPPKSPLLQTHAPTQSAPTHSAPTQSASTPIPSIPSIPSFSSVSFSFPNSPAAPKSQTRRVPPVFNVRAKAKALVKTRTQEARAARKRLEMRTMFGSFGAIMSEAQLRGGKRDPRWEERRRGDSDVDWGDEGSEDEGGEEGGAVGGTGGADGMEVDPEVEVDIEVLKKFVKGMGADGGRFVTMDDIADEERMREEDEEQREVGSSGDEDEEDDKDEGEEGEDSDSSADEEVDAVVNGQEESMIAELHQMDISDDGSESDDSSEDDDQSPRSGFQARLERLRNNARGKRPARRMSLDGDDSSDDVFDKNLSWAEEDEDFIAHIESLLDDNEQVLTGRNRKERKKLFRSIRDGTFDSDDFQTVSPARKGKDKKNDYPPELQEQWERDRQKKATKKQARALARLEAAADPLTPKKGGKKGRKAMLAAARLDSTITVIPNRVIDMVTLVQQIRRFIADVGGRPTMSLPPTNKQTRKSIHEMALAFNLTSQSKGKGDARYTTLMKTSRSGFGVNEAKVAKIVRRSGGGGGSGQFMGSSDRRDRDRDRGGKPAVPRHKEGDEVGKAAPKIGASNIGFKMLAYMGWSVGDRIGVSGGLDVPLTAVIKNTKLGLGATK